MAGEGFHLQLERTCAHAPGRGSEAHRRGAEAQEGAAACGGGVRGGLGEEGVAVDGGGEEAVEEGVDVGGVGGRDAAAEGVRVGEEAAAEGRHTAKAHGAQRRMGLAVEVVPQKAHEDEVAASLSAASRGWKRRQ